MGKCKKCTKIKKVIGREILDSRGNPTVEAEVILECGIVGVAKVPSGASTGAYEAVELRDNEANRYMGKGVRKAVENINNEINNILSGLDVTKQINIDKILIEADGTKNKSKLGANAMLGCSLAVAKAAAMVLDMPLYRYIGGCNAKKMPVPMMNIINGGRHANNSLSCQEFMIMPIGAKNFRDGLEKCTNVFHTLKNILRSEGHITAVGDEGGFAPQFESDEKALQYLVMAIDRAGYRVKDDFAIALDVAATEMYEEAKRAGEEGKYLFWKSGECKTVDDLIEYYEYICEEYPILSIEDGLAEEDWYGFKKLTDKIGKKVQLVGDDLFVTNTERIQKGISMGVSNAVLIKLNQIGTLTETLDAIEMTKKNGWNAIVSHRSGETEDTTIADIAVACNTGQIKTGAPSRSDRVAKYNRLLKIEEELNI